MPEAIPITPEIKVDVGRIRFGEAAHHPDAIKTRFKELLDQDRAEQALKELAEPRHVPHDRRDVESSLLKRYSTLRDTEGKKVAPTDPKEMWRLRNAKAKTEMYRTFLESKTVLPEFRAEVRGFLERSSSAFQDSIQGLTDVQVNAKVDSLILDDPTFRSTLVSVYEQRADPKKTLSGENSFTLLANFASKIGEPFTIMPVPLPQNFLNRRKEHKPSQSSSKKKIGFCDVFK